MSKNCVDLSKNKEKAVVALLNHTSVPAAAKASGVGQATIYTWLKKDKAFISFYREARREVVKQGIVQLQRRISGAVATLVEIMENEESPASSRVSAARTILDIGLKATEIEELEGRVEDLENEIRGRG